jgi:hypothetical protein
VCPNSSKQSLNLPRAPLAQLVAMQWSLELVLFCSLLQLSAQEGEDRELFSWTRGLKRAGRGREGVRTVIRRDERLVIVMFIVKCARCFFL